LTEKIDTKEILKKLGFYLRKIRNFLLEIKKSGDRSEIYKFWGLNEIGDD